MWNRDRGLALVIEGLAQAEAKEHIVWLGRDFWQKDFGLFHKLLQYLNDDERDVFRDPRWRWPFPRAGGRLLKGSTWETTQPVCDGIDLRRLVNDERVFIRVANLALVRNAVGGKFHLKYGNNCTELGEYGIAIFAIEAQVVFGRQGFDKTCTVRLSQNT